MNLAFGNFFRPRHRQRDQPIGVVVVNDFSWSREKLARRLNAIVSQLSHAGLHRIFVTTTVGDQYVPELPEAGAAARVAPQDLLQEEFSFALVTTDYSLHLGDALVRQALADAAKRPDEVLVADTDDPVIYGMGLRIPLSVMRPRFLATLLQAARVSPGALALDTARLCREHGMPYWLRLTEPAEMASCYREYNAKGHMPVTIQIETNTSCNMTCVMCPYHGTRQAAGRRYIPVANNTEMPIERFKELVREVKGWDDPYLDNCFRTIVPYRRGEPTLYPHFQQAIEIIKTDGLGCFFTTNASRFNRKLDEFMVDIGVDHIKISMHGATAATFREITGRDFDKIVANAKELLAVKAEKGARKPEIGVIFTIQNANKHESEAYVQQWLHLADYVALSPENRLDETISSKLYQEDLLFFEPDPARRPPCKMIMDYAWVHSGFDVPPCIGGIKDPLGYVATGKLGDLLHDNPTLNDLKDAHASGDFTRHAPCTNCKVWYGNVVKRGESEEYTYTVSPVMKVFRAKRRTALRETA